MLHNVRTYILCLCLSLCSLTKAQTLSDEARISLVTCTPGTELYARYGHTALRVLDPANKIDICFNYGIFDFNVDHFYWKFVKGETWYELGANSTRWFLYEYDEEQRQVYEQVLNLTPDQRESIWSALLTNYQPENRQYLYNFVFDNCATRPYVLIEKALGDSIIIPAIPVFLIALSSVITPVPSHGKTQASTSFSVRGQTNRCNRINVCSCLKN